MRPDLQALILKSLERHAEPINTHQIAAEAIMRAGFHPEAREILDAIDSLKEQGYPIVSEYGVEYRFYLDQPTGGDAA